MQHEHNVINQPNRVNLLLIHKYLWCPLYHNLQNAILINNHLKYTSSTLQYLRNVIVLKLLKYHKQVRSHLIQGVVEMIHEILGQFVVFQQLLANLQEEKL
jgi:hypothetical protein